MIRLMKNQMRKKKKKSKIQKKNGNFLKILRKIMKVIIHKVKCNYNFLYQKKILYSWIIKLNFSISQSNNNEVSNLSNNDN